MIKLMEEEIKKLESEIDYFKEIIKILNSEL